MKILRELMTITMLCHGLFVCAGGENEAFVEELRRLSKSSDHCDWNDEQAYRDYFIAKAERNAISLALRHPNSRLSHAVFASIVEECIDREQMQEILNKRTVQKLQDDEKRRLFAYNEKRNKRWGDSLRSVLKPILIQADDLAFVSPKCAGVETDLDMAQYKRLHSIFRDPTNCENVVFMGVSLGKPLGSNYKRLSTQDKLSFKCVAPFKSWGSNYLGIKLDNDENVQSVTLILDFVEKERFPAVVNSLFEYVHDRYMTKKMTFHFNRYNSCSENLLQKWKHGILLERDKGLKWYSIEVVQEQCMRRNEIEYFAYLTVSMDRREQSLRDEIREDMTRIRNASTVKTTVTNKKAQVVTNLQGDEMSKQEREDFQKKVMAWRKRYFLNRSLSQYNSTDQKERRRQFDVLQELVAEVAVAYSDVVETSTIKTMVQRLNRYFRSETAFFWSRQAWDDVQEFNSMISESIKQLREVVSTKGDAINFTKRADKLYLQACHGVDTWDELAKKVAAEKAAEEKRERERAFWQEERRIQAERETADAIRNQTIDVYHHW